MGIDRGKTVRDFLAEVPIAASVFEGIGIDYCCGGEQTVELACSKAHLSIEDVERRIAEALRGAIPAGGEKDWHAELLADLVAHIIETHHAFTRRELERLAPLTDTVVRVHSKDHPELLQIQAVVKEMSSEMHLHMMKEEEVVFPYIMRMEEATLEGRQVIPATFGGLGGTMSVMLHEHDTAGAHLRAIREASGNYLVPSGGCSSYRSLYEGLHAFERDMHQHVHLENNILFPRAQRMEASSQNSHSQNQQP